MAIDNLSQLIHNQETIYSFFQRIYEKELDIKILREISKKMKPLAPVTGMLSTQKSRKVVEEYIKFCDSLSSQDLKSLQTQLAADYARLFLSLNKAPAHPSESTYREGTMMQHRRDEVLQIYWDYGVSPKTDFTEPEDHIATELSFMAFLCQNTDRALKKKNMKKARGLVKAQKDFLENHLNKWVPNLVKDILEYSRTPFYKGIAVLTQEFLKISLSTADEIIVQLKG